MPFADNNQAPIRFRTLTAAAITTGGANIFQNGTRIDFEISYIV